VTEAAPSRAAPLDAWLARCASRGLRLTAPRKAVLCALHETDGWLDAVALFQRARRHCARISLPTIYRSLHELETLGLVDVHAQGRNARSLWSLHDTASAVRGNADVLALELLARLADRLGYRLDPLHGKNQ